MCSPQQHYPTCSGKAGFRFEYDGYPRLLLQLVILLPKLVTATPPTYLLLSLFFYWSFWRKTFLWKYGWFFRPVSAENIRKTFSAGMSAENIVIFRPVSRENRRKNIFSADIGGKQNYFPPGFSRKQTENIYRVYFLRTYISVWNLRNCAGNDPVTCRDDNRHRNSSKHLHGGTETSQAVPITQLLNTPSSLHQIRSESRQMPTADDTNTTPLHMLVAYLIYVHACNTHLYYRSISVTVFMSIGSLWLLGAPERFVFSECACACIPGRGHLAFGAHTISS